MMVQYLTGGVVFEMRCWSRWVFGAFGSLATASRRLFLVGWFISCWCVPVERAPLRTTRPSDPPCRGRPVVSRREISLLKVCGSLARAVHGLLIRRCPSRRAAHAATLCFRFCVESVVTVVWV